MRSWLTLLEKDGEGRLMERTVERRSVHDGWNEVDEQTRGSEEDVGQTSQINASQRTELLLSSDSRLGGGAQTGSGTISMSSRAQKFHLLFVMADPRLLSEVPFEPILQIAAV